VDLQERYTEASVKTADNLRTIAHSSMVRDLSRLSLPEIDAIIDLVSRVIPAGNVPGVILSGLARLPERRLPPETVRRDVNLLLKGVEQALDRAVYGAFFAGPAAVIWGYQNLLRLIGKEPEDAFPEGVWQFYVSYALREDTARHAYETHGFDTLLDRHHIQLAPVDRVVSWVMAAIYCIHQYDALLENEWRERVYASLLCEVTRGQADAARYTNLFREWVRRRPYGRSSDTAAGEDYPAYRRRKFDLFLAEAVRDLRPHLRRRWARMVRATERRALPAYKRQMSLLAYLDPGPYSETRTPLSLQESRVGLIYQGRYFMVAACAPGTGRPADVADVRRQVAAVLHGSSDLPPAQFSVLSEVRRAALPRLLAQMDAAVVENVQALCLAPILINCGPRSRDLPLAELRRAGRGVGGHALTLFDTGGTMVFDQSHIFFDGAWGAELAEIMTNEALSWAVYLHTLPPAQPGERPYSLTCQLQEAERELVRQAAHVTPEAAAESEAVDLKGMLTLRRLFKQRNDLIRLTVNDLLVLYRAVHAATYRPAPELVRELQSLAEQDHTRQAARAALEAVEGRQVNPAILIPVDASQRSPKDRLYPMTFQVPLEELDLLNLHRQVIAALDAYESAAGDRAPLYAEFDRLQRDYLATLAGFGAVMSRAKEIALSGASASVGTIKLLAYMPPPLQRMLDRIPTSFEVLNDIIKGREVLSNLGAVAPSSTITRFITAKDDNDKKRLAWGVVTDAGGVMRVSLRDFRPHVGLLAACGRKELATRIAQHYLDAYVHGLNGFVADLRRITLTSRETRLRKPE